MTPVGPPNGQPRTTAATAQRFTLVRIGTVWHEPESTSSPATAPAAGAKAPASGSAKPVADETAPASGSATTPFAGTPIPGAVRPDNASQSDRAALRPARIEIDVPYRDGLLDLGHFSHVLVLWWALRCDSAADRTALRVHPRPAPEHLMGVFATRSPARPNPIAVSVCRLLEVDEYAGMVRVAAIDAGDDTPVVDLKPYIPSQDRVRRPRMADWFPAAPEWACEQPDV